MVFFSSGVDSALLKVLADRAGLPACGEGMRYA